MMNARKWTGLVIGLSLLGNGLVAVPALANPPNQSDITGTNIWNSPAPIFEEGGELDPAILERAQRLDRELGEAAARCCNTATPRGPRRFARQPRDPNVACANPECERLDELVRETEVFLDEVDREVEAVRAAGNPIW